MVFRLAEINELNLKHLASGKIVRLTHGPGPDGYCAELFADNKFITSQGGLASPKACRRWGNAMLQIARVSVADPGATTMAVRTLNEMFKTFPPPPVPNWS